MDATVREVGQGLDWCNAFLLVQFRTFETVQRDGRLPFVPMITWSEGTLLMYARQTLPDAIKANLTDFLEEFSAAWLMQNQNTSTSAP
jgi:hypothetical protein